MVSTERNNDMMTGMRNFYIYADHFPNRRGSWVFGSVDKGLAHVRAEMANPENIGPEVRDLLLRLEKEYIVAKRLYTKEISRSDDAPLERPVGRLHDIIASITSHEVSLLSVQQSACTEKNRLEISHEMQNLLAAAAETNFYAHYGDYLAILNHELKNDKLLNGLAFRKELVGPTKVLVAKIDKEKEKKMKDNTTETPITDSIHIAHSYVESMFDTPEVIIDIFRQYAKQNYLFHSGVKELADEGQMAKLWACLLRDMQQLPFLRVSVEKKQHASNILKAVGARFFAEMSWDPDVLPMVSALGKERENKWKQKQTEKKKTPLELEKASRDEECFKRQKARELQQEKIEIVAEHRRRRYQQVSDYSEHLNMPLNEQEGFKDKIEDLLRDEKTALDTIAQQQKQIASLMEDAKRMKEKVKIYQDQERSLNTIIDKQQDTIDKQQDTIVHQQKQIANLTEDSKRMILVDRENFSSRIESLP